MNNHGEDALFLIFNLHKIRMFFEYVIIDRSLLLYKDPIGLMHILEGIGLKNNINISVKTID
jgi:hypothetical protein